jgi:phosphohistidine swiveling domain-containing protein
MKKLRQLSLIKGRTCHAAIIAQMGIPAIVGCGNATELIKEGMLLTASCKVIRDIFMGI